MAYSICSDLYRLEDANPSFPLGSAPIDDELDPDYIIGTEDDNDDYLADMYCDDYSEIDDYEEPMNCDAEFYAANDPSNWD